MSFWSRFKTKPAATMWDATTDLGSVLLKMGKISDKDLMEAATRQVRGRALLGEILIDMGRITRADLDSALHAQLLMRQGKPGEAMLGIVEARTEAMHQDMLGLTVAPRR